MEPYSPGCGSPSSLSAAPEGNPGIQATTQPARGPAWARPRSVRSVRGLDRLRIRLTKRGDRGWRRACLLCVGSPRAILLTMTGRPHLPKLLQLGRSENSLNPCANLVFQRLELLFLLGGEVQDFRRTGGQDMRTAMRRTPRSPRGSGTRRSRGVRILRLQERCRPGHREQGEKCSGAKSFKDFCKEC